MGVVVFKLLLIIKVHFDVFLVVASNRLVPQWVKGLIVRDGYDVSDGNVSL